MKKHRPRKRKVKAWLKLNPWHRYDAGAEKTACTDTSLTSPEAKAFHTQCMEKIATHRPIAQLCTPEQDSKISKEVITPGGTKLYLKGVYGTLAVYSEHASESPQTIINASFFTLFLTHLAEHVNFHGIVPPPADAIKIQEAEIDLEQLELIRDETHGHRRISQNKAMSSASPTRSPLKTSKVKEILFDEGKICELIAALDLPEDESNKIFSWVKKLTPEWLHLIDHASWGDRAQSPTNLVYGSRECNTQMMVVEAFIKAWLEKYPDCKVSILVKAKLIPGTHLCERIDYDVITTNGLNKSFTFYPLSPARPLLQTPSYLYYASQFSSRTPRAHTEHTLAAAAPLDGIGDQIVSREQPAAPKATDEENQFSTLRPCRRKLEF